MFNRRGLFASVLVLGLAALPLGAHADEWKIGTPVPPKNIMATFINQMIQGAADKSGGQMKIDYYQNFNEQDLSEQLILGRIQMAYVSATGVGVSVPEAAVLNAPFLWNSEEEKDYVTDKYVVPLLTTIMAAKGITLVRFGDAGWTSVYCKTDACTDADKFKGMKARVSPNAAGRFFWDRLGANGVVLPLTDTWTALQTGVVDAGDLTFGFYLVTPAAKSDPNFFFTRHSHQPAFFLANTAAWAGLDQTTRDEIVSSMPSTMEMRNAILNDEAGKEKAFVADGGHTYHLTEQQLDKFRGKVVPGLPDLIKQFGGQSQALYEAILAGKKEYADMHK